VELFAMRASRKAQIVYRVGMWDRTVRSGAVAVRDSFMGDVGARRSVAFRGLPRRTVVPGGSVGHRSRGALRGLIELAVHRRL
jgi:hypothetical protein